jgi:hypothetical protein
MQFVAPPPPANQPYLASLVEAIRRAFLPLISKDEAVSRVILQSPNGTAYNVTVSDAGVLTVTLNDGKSRI